MRKLASALIALSVCALAAVPASPASATSLTCRRTLGPGEHTISVPFQGRDFPVTVYVPARARPADRLPAILNLHGTQSTGAGQLAYSNMKQAADADHYLVLAPSGALPAAGGFAWNVPGVVTPPPGARDDIAFLGRVITTATSELCVDRTRIYGTGYSGGGRMISAFACQRPQRLAAIAPVAGLRAGRPDPADPTRPDPASCSPARPVPVIAFHGRQDTTNPYEGGGSEYWRYSVPAALHRWTELNHYRARPRATPLTSGVTRISYGRNAVLYAIANGGHTWPGRPIDNGNGPVTHEIDANRLMWRFFSGRS
ncbi:polyhydroxybutyrate depolymerase [Actinoplanes sp. NPDC049596]|uniref:alpha/beta hydrolase family esterase n=1 Tax=unclassified Actinoplanes TaxID=2626549 RepID=UPI00344170B3